MSVATVIPAQATVELRRHGLTRSLPNSYDVRVKARPPYMMSRLYAVHAMTEDDAAMEGLRRFQREMRIQPDG